MEEPILEMGIYLAGLSTTGWAIYFILGTETRPVKQLILVKSRARSRHSAWEVMISNAPKIRNALMHSTGKV